MGFIEEIMEPETAGDPMGPTRLAEVKNRISGQDGYAMVAVFLPGKRRKEIPGPTHCDAKESHAERRPAS